MTDMEKFKKEAEKVAKKYNLSLVVLFGSQATGKTHPKSDVDIGVVGERELDMMETGGIGIDLSYDLKAEVDVANFSRVSPLVLRSMFKNAIPLYEKIPGLFYQYKIYSFKVFVEARPLALLRRKSLESFLALR